LIGLLGSNTDLAVYLGEFFPMRSFIGDCCETAVIKFFIFENNPVESDIFTGFPDVFDVREKLYHPLQ
jgi:hypothetical protein